MASYTTNYNLKKPAAEDFYDVKDFNDNADAIDTALSEKAEIEELAKRVPLVNLYYDSSPTTTGNVIYKWGSNAERSIYNFGGLLKITSGEVMRSNVTIFFPQVASGETPFGYVIARMITA